jgi:hypothetical protein
VAKENGELVVFDPLANATTYPTEMAHAIAQGLEEPAEVAARFGITGAAWERLVKWQPFLDDIARRQAELKESGWVFAAKARLYADMLQDDVAKIALGSEVSLSQKLAVLENFQKAGDLLPKKAQGEVAQGTGFSITINLDRAHSESTVKRVEVVDVKAKEVKE